MLCVRVQNDLRNDLRRLYHLYKSVSNGLECLANGVSDHIKVKELCVCVCLKKT